VFAHGFGAFAAMAVKGLPVSIAQAPTAGIDGLLLRVGRSDGGSRAGRARVTVDYSAFRGAFGGLSLWGLSSGTGRRGVIVHHRSSMMATR
jgi:hypothetical protein